VLGEGGTDTRGRCTGLRISPLVANAAADGRYSIAINGAVIPLYACLFVEAAGFVGATTVTGVTEVDSVTMGFTGLDSLFVAVPVQP
jgi:hypothetical protein